MTPEKGLDIATTKVPDLILLDIKTPPDDADVDLTVEAVGHEDDDRDDGPGGLKGAAAKALPVSLAGDGGGLRMTQDPAGRRRPPVSIIIATGVCSMRRWVMQVASNPRRPGHLDLFRFYHAVEFRLSAPPVFQKRRVWLESPSIGAQKSKGGCLRRLV